MEELTLASDFPAVTVEDWLKSVEKALAGAPFESLRTPLLEGFATEPLYTAADLPEGAEPLDLRAGPWRIIQLADWGDPEGAKTELADDLANGCSGIWLQFGGNLPYGGGVLGARTASELAGLLSVAGSSPPRLYVSGGMDALAGTAILVAAAEQLGWRPDQLRGSAGLDPLSVVAATGDLPADRREIFADSVDAAHFLRDRGFGLTPLLVSGRAWHQAGGSAVEELAFCLSAAVAYWRALTGSGMTSARAAAQIDFVLTADSDLFLGIAKFRAARMLWARALEAAGLPPARTEFLAEMSFRTLTERDPHVNLLRGTASAFAAGIGGADGVLLIPYDAATGEPQGFSRRMARNTSLILQHESHLDQVRDAAAGSYYVERLTHEFCSRAWSLFRQVEADGGLVEWIVNGKAARRLCDAADQRNAAIATRRQRITGVSAFPNLAEEILPAKVNAAGFEPDSFVADGSDFLLPPAEKGVRFAALAQAAKSGAAIEELERSCRTVYEPLAPVAMLGRRAAEPFEELRRASDVAFANVGSRPPVFIALLGEAADWRARAGWLKNFFAVGGVEAIVPERGFADIASLAEAFRESPAPVACLCSSDAVYASTQGAAAALKEAGAIFLYLAGTGESLRGLRAEDRRSINRLLYEGCNAAALLAELHQILRVEDMGHMDPDEDFEDEALP